MSILTAADVSTVMGLLASDAPIWVEDENGETRPISGVVVRNGQVRLQMAPSEGTKVSAFDAFFDTLNIKLTEPNRHPHKYDGTVRATFTLDGSDPAEVPV